MATNLKKRFNFVRTALFDFRVAAIASSSKYVVKRVEEALPFNLNFIVEYGPGNGIMTKALLKRLSPAGKYLAIEANKNFFDGLKQINDKRLIPEHGLAQDVAKFFSAHKLASADAIVSSIPFTLLTKQERHDLLKTTRDILMPQGKFIVFHQYSTFPLKELRQHFREVKVRYELRNIFPCFIFYCTK